MALSRRTLLGAAAGLPPPCRSRAARAAGAGPEDRRADRPVRPLQGPRRARSRSQSARQALEDFGVAGKGMNVEVVSADHQNKPDVGAAHRPAMVRPRRRRHHPRSAATPASALAVAGVAQRKEQGLRQLRRRHLRPDRRAVQRQHDPLGVRHLHAGEIHRRRDGARRAATPGSSSPPTTPSATRCSATPPASSSSPAARSSAPPLYPFPGTTDFSSFILQAQASGAKVLGLANAGADTINLIKQAHEFGITPPCASPACWCSSPTSTRSAWRPPRA